MRIHLGFNGTQFNLGHRCLKLEVIYLLPLVVLKNVNGKVQYAPDQEQQTEIHNIHKETQIRKNQYLPGIWNKQII